jgi:hypothetical protein
MRMQVLRGISSATDRIAMHGPQQIDMTVRASNAYGWVASGGRDVEFTPPKFAWALSSHRLGRLRSTGNLRDLEGRPYRAQTHRAPDVARPGECDSFAH